MKSNYNSLAYELGVMMFNATYNGNFTTYDVLGNFTNILTALDGSINMDDLRDGFYAEAFNFGITEEQDKKEKFEKAKKIINDYMGEDNEI